MPETHAALVVDLEGNLPQQSPRFTRSLDRFSKRGQRNMRALSRATAAAGRGLDRLGNRYSALVTGATAIAGGRFLVNLERRFTRLGIQTGKSVKEMDALKRKIFEVSQQPDIRINPDQLIDAVEKIVSKTGDLDIAVDNLDNLARGIGGTGSQGEDVGSLVGSLKMFGITLRQDVLPTLDMFARQGDAGAFEMRDFATQSERAVAAFAGMGYRGKQAAKEMGALLQVARMGTGSAEEAVTAFENVLKTITDKGKDLQAAGITVFDPEKLKQGVEAFRPMPGILEEIIQKAKGRTTVLSNVFDVRGMRLINVLLKDFNNSGNLESLERFMKIQGDGAEINARSARAAQDAAGALQMLTTAAKTFADNNLTEPIKAFADALNSVDPENLQTAMKILGGAGLAFGGAFAARKLYKGGKVAAGMFRGGRSPLGPLAGLAGAAGGATPVAVVNWPAGMGGDFGTGGGRRGRGRVRKGRLTVRDFARGRGGPAAGMGRMGRLGRFSRYGGRALGPLAVALSAMSLADTLSDDTLSSQQKIVESASTGGGMAGGLAGAKGGAVLGTMFLPGLGTAIGGLGGGLLGYFFGETIARQIAERLTGDGDAGPLSAADRQRARHGGKAEVTLKIEGGPVRVQGFTADGIDIAVDSGLALSP